MINFKQQKRTRRSERKIVREEKKRTNEVQRPNEFGKEKKNQVFPKSSLNLVR